MFHDLLSDERMLTITELSKFLRVSTRTVYRMLEEGELPFAIKIKGSWRFKTSDINSWLDSQKLSQGQPVK